MTFNDDFVKAFLIQGLPKMVAKSKIPKTVGLFPT